MVNPVDKYISSFPLDTQSKLQEIRSIIKKLAPDAVEGFNYQMPSYKLGKPLVYFAGYAHHLGFYPTPSVITHFVPKLSAYKYAKGSIQFPLDQQLPVKLITEIIKFRLSEIT